MWIDCAKFFYEGFYEDRSVFLNMDFFFSRHIFYVKEDCLGKAWESGSIKLFES